ncbi:histone-lysine N-methyltransferase eggless-like isoform X2 [Amblyomma americanum]
MEGKESAAAARLRRKAEKLNSSDPEVLAWELAAQQRKNDKAKAKRAAETPEQREIRIAKRRRKEAEKRVLATSSASSSQGRSLQEATEKASASENCCSAMTLSLGSEAGGGDCRDTNGDGPSEPKRMRLDEGEQYFVCDCDILGTIDRVFSSIDVEDGLKQEMCKFSRLCNLDKLEREFLDIDVTFDKMEHDLQKLKEKKSLEKTSALNLPEIHFFDVFVKADRNFKMPDPASSRRPAPSLTTHTPRNASTAVKAPGLSEEIIPVGNYPPTPHNLPPEGPIVRKELEISSKVLATRNFPLGVFYKARIIQIQEPSEESESEPLYRVKLEAKKANTSSRPSKWYPKRELAYADRPTVVLPVGTRVVATYSDEASPPRQSLYAGIIAEPPKPLNRYRYLVFFDDGYAQYVDIDKVYVMCGASKNVWEDVFLDTRDFVRGYLEKYPERPMLRLRKGQTVKTEWNGDWWMARVVTVDSSLVKMSFEADKRTEWIYRGSTRFSPLYSALHQSGQNAATTGGRVRRHNLMPVKSKQHKPFVQYTRTLEDGAPKEESAESPKKATASARNVARKSTTQDRKFEDPDGLARNALGILMSQAGTREVLQVDAKDVTTYNRVGYTSHECSPSCVAGDDPDAHKGKNPLAIPSFYGWERQILKQSKKSKRRVQYTAPCGRRLRNIEEVAHFLRLCKSLLTVDLFCFDSLVSTFCEFKPEIINTCIEDLTYGKEQVIVPCVNSVDDTYPAFVEYSSERYAGKGVNLNLDEEFLCGCDCEDDCQDREKCSCQQLTVAATEALASGRNPDAGYHHRRLLEPHVTGVYECNSQCHCSRRCFNRVVQNGLRSRLQVFKTEKRGWGIRCLDDLPQGSFICVYSGQLLTEQAANEDGNQYGDEYLAELDHIEVVEKQKEGYESDVVGASDEEDTDESVDEEDIREGVSDSDYDSGAADVPRQPSSRLCKQRVESLADDSSDSNKANEDEDGDSGSSDGSQKPSKKSKEENNAKDKAKEGLPEKSACRKSSDTKSTKDNKPCDQTAGEDNQPGTKSENAKALKKQKKQTGDKNMVKAKVGTVDGPTEGTEPQPPRLPSTRSFFNEEYCYIMDAKNCGNIGRYLNHSCSPNVFVQNVFVDTHDLRFPWVSFFAARYIRAGVELTWDYNYDVGSVPERVMYCHCGSLECRGRLI